MAVWSSVFFFPVGFCGFGGIFLVGFFEIPNVSGGIFLRGRFMQKIPPFSPKIPLNFPQVGFFGPPPGLNFKQRGMPDF